MKYTWFLDSGHGGFLDSGYVTAPDKMYSHSPSEIFYEGVFNRQIKDLLMRKLWEENIKCIDTCPTELDVPLPVRCNVINAYYKHYSNGVLLSLHSNAGGGSGFEVWTSIGQTRSDQFAEILGRELVSGFRDILFRSDTVDGDLDKESQFYILKNTDCPAILPECLFFDNYHDYLLLMDPDFRVAYVHTLVNFIRKAEQLNI